MIAAPPTNLMDPRQLLEIAKRIAARSNLTIDDVLNSWAEQLGGGAAGGTIGGALMGGPPALPGIPSLPMAPAPVAVPMPAPVVAPQPVPTPPTVPGRIPGVRYGPNGEILSDENGNPVNPGSPLSPQQTQDLSRRDALATLGISPDSEMYNWLAANQAMPFVKYMEQMTGRNPFTGEPTVGELDRQLRNAVSIGRFTPGASGAGRPPGPTSMQVDPATGHVVQGGGGISVETPGPKGFSMQRGEGNGTAANTFLRSTVGNETGEQSWSDLENHLATTYPDFWPALQRGEDVGSYTTPEMRAYLRGRKQRAARQAGAV